MLELLNLGVSENAYPNQIQQRPPRGFSLKTPENKAVPRPFIQGV
jgi:hypothetical protein